MNIRRPMCCIAVAFLLFISILVKALHLFPDYGAIYGEDYSFSGQICDKSISADKMMVYLKKVNIEGFPEHEINPTGMIMYMSLENGNTYDYLKMGSYLSAAGKLYSFDEAENYGQFNSKEYYAIRGYHFRAYDCNIISVKSPAFRMTERLWILKERIKSIYSTYLNDSDAGIISAIMLADKTTLDPQIKNLYQISGIAHILSLSGLHIATLGLALLNGILKLIRALFAKSSLCDDMNLGGRKTIITAGITASAVMFLYCVMTGMNVSSLRALIMFILGLIGKMTGRSYDLLSAAAFSSMAVVAVNPLYIYDAGFQLSFAAVISIGLILPVLTSILYSNGRSKIIQGILLSLAIMIGTLPISAYHYHQISILGILLNIIVVPLMSVVLIMGCVMAVVGIIFPADLFQSLLWLCGQITHVIFAVYEYLASACVEVKWNIIITGKPTTVQVIVYYCLIFIIGVYIKLSIRHDGIDRIGRPFIGHKKFFARFLERLILCAILMLACVILLLGHRREYIIRNLSVGQGDCTIIQNKTNVIIVDCGSSSDNSVGKYRLIPSLKANAVNNIDTIFISHFDEDHVNGLFELIEDDVYNKRIRRVVISSAASIYDGQTENYRRLFEELITYDIPIYTMGAGDKAVIGDSVIECLSPFDDADYDDTNSASLILSVTDSVSGRKAILMGDADFYTEHILTKRCSLRDKNGYDYLKVGHHGSDSSTSSEFLDFINCGHKNNTGVCVISVGLRNRYGHPGEDTMKRLSEYYSDSHILRTDINHETVVSFR